MKFMAEMDPLVGWYGSIKSAFGNACTCQSGGIFQPLGTAG
jgi:hypothetical protein